MSEDRIRGKITKLHSTGYGFIHSKDKPFTRIFFHWSKLKVNTLNFTELKIGMTLEFEPVQWIDKGWRAKDIEVVVDTEIKEAEIEVIK